MTRADDLRALADAIDAAPTAHDAALVLAERFALPVCGDSGPSGVQLLVLSKAAMARLVRDLSTYPFAAPPAAGERDPSEG